MKKTIKVITVLIISLSMLVSIAGCNGKSKDDTSKTLLGMYINEDDGVALEFKKGDKVVFYSADGEEKGEFEYDNEDKEGVISIDDEEVDFSVDKKKIDVDNLGVFVLEDDKDFDIDEFIEEFGNTTEEPTKKTTDEPTDKPTNKTDETGITLSGSDDKGWPAKDMVNIPDPKEIVTYYSSTTDGCYVMIEGMTKDEAEDYVEAIKDAGFTESPYETTSSDGIYYWANDTTGATAYFWYILDGTASISYTVPEVES